VEKRSESSEDTSTPVGPAPTITKWRRECFWASVRPGMEAFSKQSWMREAIFIASLALRRKTACSDTPGVLKVLFVLLEVRCQPWLFHPKEKMPTPGAITTISYCKTKSFTLRSSNAGMHLTVLALKSMPSTSALTNLIFLFVCLIGVSTRLNSYNPHAALARRGVYGVVVSGEMTVMECLVSSWEVARVEPAQPEPMMITSFRGSHLAPSFEDICS
jgi:hypothetical protein